LSQLLGVQSAEQAYSADQSLQRAQRNGGNLLSGAQLSFGFSSSNSTSTTNATSSNAVGSTLSGQNVTVTATGGDLNVLGSTISGQNVGLSATGDVEPTGGTERVDDPDDELVELREHRWQRQLARTALVQRNRFAVERKQRRVFGATAEHDCRSRR
jgi:hypothetical protein